MTNEKVSIIGAGHIGTALVKGFIEAGKCRRDHLRATIPDEGKAKELSEKLGIEVLTDNKKACSWAEVVIFSVKPQVLGSVLKEVADYIRGRTLIVSVAAGITTTFIETVLNKKVPVIRLMPNVAVLTGQGATGICTGRYTDEKDVAYVKDLFSSVGLVMEVSEDLMDAVTGLSGTGPMYIFQVIEGLSDAGVKVGLSRHESYTLAVQTVLGAALMARDLGEHPGKLKDLVTSPAGTAISALHLMERSGFRAVLMDAVEEATRRSEELGRLHMKQGGRGAKKSK